MASGRHGDVGRRARVEPLLLLPIEQARQSGTEIDACEVGGARDVLQEWLQPLLQCSRERVVGEIGPTGVRFELADEGCSRTQSFELVGPWQCAQAELADA